MPIIAAGSNATISVAANQMLTVESHGGSGYAYEYPPGTKLLDSGSSNVFGPFSGAGSVKLTSLQGQIFYELATAPSTMTYTSGGSGGGSQDILYAVAIPFTFSGTSFAPQQIVAGPIAFTPITTGAVKNAQVYVRLIADGTNVPTFTGVKEWGGSLGYDNRLGIGNQITFWYDGVDYWYSASQAVGAIPASLGVTLSGPNTGVVSSASMNFNVGVTPIGSTITGTIVVTPNDATGGGTFTPATVSLTAASPTGTFTYTPNASAAVRTISVTSNGALANPTAISYNVTLVAASPRLLPKGTGVTETGTGPYTYSVAANSPFAAANDSVFQNAFQSGVDGYASAVQNGFGAATSGAQLIGFATINTPVNYTSMPYIMYADTGSGNYAVQTSGAVQTPTNLFPIAANGDVMRLRRVGSSLIGEVARAATPTLFTTIFTWTAVPTGIAYVHVMVAGSATATNLAISGLV